MSNLGILLKQEVISGDVEMKTEDCVEQKIPFLV